MASQREARTGLWTRKINLSVNFTSLLTFFFLLIAAMTAAYIWGVMAGRKQELPAISSSSVEPGEKEIQQEPTAILKAHELEFTQILKGESPRIKENVSKEAAEKIQKPVPQGTSEASAAIRDTSTPPVSPPASETAEESESEGPENKNHDYIFQVAALKDEDSMDKLRQALEGKGFRTRMEHTGKIYMVMVHIRGDNSRVEELNRIAAELRLGPPLLRSKKPVKP